MLRLFLFLGAFNLLLSGFSYSQSFYLDPSEEENLFNPLTLKDLKVKRAVVKTSFKYDLDIIKPTNEVEIYEFGEHGFLTRLLKINPFRHRLDTIEIIYYRNNNKDVITKVKHDPKYTYVELYKYSNGNQVKIENYQMRKTQKWNESLYPEKLMWSDSMAYNNNELRVYNQFSSLYKRYRIEKNNQGLALEVKSYDRSGKWLNTNELTYSNKRISNIKTTHSNKMMFDSEKSLLYGSFGLEEEKYYKDGSLEYIRKITYNKLGLPVLDISRNEKTKKMTIKKIEWSTD